MPFVRLLRGFLVATLLGGVAGCEKDDDGGAAGGSGQFLRPTDLPPGAKFKTVSESDLKSKLKDQVFLYDDGPKSAAKLRGLRADSSQAEDDKCIEALFDELKAEGDAHTLRFEGHLDATKCFKDEGSGLTISVTFGGFSQYTCDSVDLSPYLGKSLGELSSAEGKILTDVECSTATSLMNSQADVNVSGTITDAETGKARSVRFQSVTYNYTGAADGTPCTVARTAEDRAYADGCLSIDKAVDLIDQSDGKAAETEGAEDYERYEMAGIKGNLEGDGLYFTAGKMKAQVNGWLGEVTFSGDDTPPFFSMNDGKKLVEGALGVSGSGYLRFGDTKTMVAGSCGAFTLELRAGDQKVPAAGDVEVELTSSDAKIFSDAECKVEESKFKVAKASSTTPFYAKPKAADTTSFSVSGQAKTTSYGSPGTLYVTMSGIDTGSLKFTDVTAIRPGECKQVKIVHYFDEPAKADIVIALASEDAELYADSGCATAATAVTFKSGAKSAAFYLKVHSGKSSITLQATPAKPAASISNLYLDVDKETVQFSGAEAITVNACTVYALKHGYESGDAATTQDLVVALSSVTVHFYSDAACTAEITEITIPSGETQVDFHVKATSAGSSLMTANPAGDDIASDLHSVTVSM